jgi:hypothetical protein
MAGLGGEFQFLQGGWETKRSRYAQRIQVSIEKVITEIA